MANQTVEELKIGWDEAKKQADSLSLDFRGIQQARQREAEARHKYFKLLGHPIDCLG